MTKRTFYLDHVDSTPLVAIWIATTELGLAAVSIGRKDELIHHITRHQTNVQTRDGNSLSAKILKQIREYLKGDLRAFTFPIDWTYLTRFQVMVLQATCQIPYGQVRTYGQIAQQVNKPRAARAVGRAQATNPMPLVIPCHRVIGADGELHGYGAGKGLATKTWLLQLERAI